MLLEDQYGVGGVVAIGTVSGTVEGVSLPITRLRDVNGVAWHIRNGTIQQAGNEYPAADGPAAAPCPARFRRARGRSARHPPARRGIPRGWPGYQRGRPPHH